MSLYDRNLALLDDHAIPYREVSHEAVLDYPTAHAVRQRFGLRGVESKSLFLRLRGGGYAMLPIIGLAASALATAVAVVSGIGRHPATSNRQPVTS